jgi:Tol biopolymer transport system component
MSTDWSTFSPNASMLIYAADGVMTLLDVETGEPIGPNDGVLPLPDGMKANMPDWSALGDNVAFALGPKAGTKDIERASIAVLPYVAGEWGEIEILVPSAGDDDNNFFPAWSPDSRYIAYVNASQKSKDAASATLRLVSAEGGDPISLTRLNERVNDEDGVTEDRQLDAALGPEH